MSKSPWHAFSALRMWWAARSTRGIAVFVDGDSISARHAELVLEHLGQRHRISIVRVYGNINNRSASAWSSMIKRQGVVMRHLPNLVKGKNGADIALTIDALELHLTRPFASYAVLSSDADFTPLVLRLKENGAQVLGFGHKGASDSFRRACTKFTQISHLRHGGDS